jgi:hypothetical protein
LRSYQPPAAALDSILERQGFRPVWRDGSTYLLPFDSLAARHAAWSRFNADPEWARIRSEIGRVSEVALYRCYPGGKIFEMSL